MRDDAPADGSAFTEGSTEMDISKKICLVLMSGAVAAMTAGSSTSQETTSDPLSWHSGWFVKNMCYKDARTFARKALERHGFRAIYTPPNAVLGSNNTTIVEVSYAPAQTSYRPHDFANIHFTVTATSNSSSAAENGRNRVRESIVKTSYYDDC
ncbi:hypothetical protein [Nonomuraea dietziae]|uniref:hypothetical protein n=1 Tax=Nonomuraea dietziae TaxID=65515 RepID=UPI003403E26A